ncbi:hypothetical protein [Sulfurovum sp.]|uniref:hypothetical protein n=1 Tax=Sulfurovum sp. TaxID=1969726 RepID=UPI002867BB3B|nr:hypothetical protein [Sulfurovum sp.]
MTRTELAKILDVDIKTLSNWEKNKPEMVRLLNQGLALDDSIEATERHLNELKKIREEANNGKFKLK